MRPPLWLLTAALLLAVACAAPPPDAAPSTPDAGSPAAELPFRPNILWLVAEDMSPYLPAYGDATIETPTLSRLAEEGVRFTNVFSVSGVCAPSRYALATGRYPSSDGAHHMRTQYVQEHMDALGLTLYEAVPPPEVMMMSEVLRRHGYYATNNAKQDYQFRPPVTAWDESSNTAHWRNRPPGQPFFSIFNFEVTHESRIWAKAEDSLWVADDLDVPIPPYLPDTELARRDVRRMYSNIKEMDHQVGQILAQLEADGLLDSTIVVWYTDHGGPLPRQKRLLYDSGLRVPLIVRFPDARFAGSIDDRLVSFVDVAPTTFSLAGIEPPDYLQGQAVLGPYAEAPRAYIYAAADRFDTEYDRIRAVRDQRFKYLRNFRPEQGYYLPVAFREQMPIMQELLRLRDEGRLDAAQQQWFRPSKPPEELFDTHADPHELHNLADDPAYHDQLVELRAALDQWMTATADQGHVPEGELIEGFWPGWQQPVTAAPVAERADGVIALRSATEGASIGYQILRAGEAPSERWQVYTAPVPLRPGEHLRAVAHRIGYAPSAAVEVE